LRLIFFCLIYTRGGGFEKVSLPGKFGGKGVPLSGKFGVRPPGGN